MTRLLLPALAILFVVSCEQQRAPGHTAAERTAAQPAAASPPPAPGRVAGTVRLEGPAPSLPALLLSPTVERECGKQLPDRSLLVGEANAVEGVVVSIDSPPAPGGATEVVIDQRRCAFVPVVAAARAGGVVLVRNSDPLIHNVRADADTRQLFNIGMPLEGMTTKKPLPRAPSIVDLKCDIHPWMHAWVKTFDHPFFAITGPDGRFELAGIPAGARRLVFWHPRLGERSLEIEVKPGGALTQDLAWPAGAAPP